jgi:hypothetical protein
MKMKSELEMIMCKRKMMVNVHLKFQGGARVRLRWMDEEMEVRL